MIIIIIIFYKKRPSYIFKSLIPHTVLVAHFIRLYHDHIITAGQLASDVCGVGCLTSACHMWTGRGAHLAGSLAPSSRTVPLEEGGRCGCRVSQLWAA